MVDIISSIIIDAPLPVVAAYAAEPDNAPLWYKYIRSVKWNTDKPLRVGSRVAFQAKFRGKELSYVYEVTDFMEGELLVMKTFKGPFPMETSYKWQSLGAKSTMMTLRNRGEPSGFIKVLSPLMKFAMKNAHKKDLKLLKSILENRFI